MTHDKITVVAKLPDGRSVNTSFAPSATWEDGRIELAKEFGLKSSDGKNVALRGLVRGHSISPEETIGTLHREAGLTQEQPLTIHCLVPLPTEEEDEPKEEEEAEPGEGSSQEPDVGNAPGLPDDAASSFFTNMMSMLTRQLSAATNGGESGSPSAGQIRIGVPQIITMQHGPDGRTQVTRVSGGEARGGENPQATDDEVSAMLNTILPGLNLVPQAQETTPRPRAVSPVVVERTNEATRPSSAPTSQRRGDRPSTPSNPRNQPDMREHIRHLAQISNAQGIIVPDEAEPSGPSGARGSIPRDRRSSTGVRSQSLQRSLTNTMRGLYQRASSRSGRPASGVPLVLRQSRSNNHPPGRTIPHSVTYRVVRQERQQPLIRVTMGDQERRQRNSDRAVERTTQAPETDTETRRPSTGSPSRAELREAHDEIANHFSQVRNEWISNTGLICRVAEHILRDSQERLSQYQPEDMPIEDDVKRESQEDMEPTVSAPRDMTQHRRVSTPSRRVGRPLESAPYSHASQERPTLPRWDIDRGGPQRMYTELDSLWNTIDLLKRYVPNVYVPSRADRDTARSRSRTNGDTEPEIFFRELISVQGTVSMLVMYYVNQYAMRNRAESRITSGRSELNFAEMTMLIASAQAKLCAVNARSSYMVAEFLPETVLPPPPDHDVSSE